jgi:hypothetical protein
VGDKDKEDEPAADAEADAEDIWRKQSPDRLGLANNSVLGSQCVTVLYSSSILNTYSCSLHQGDTVVCPLQLPFSSVFSSVHS